MDEKLYYVPTIILYILRKSKRHDVSAFRLLEVASRRKIKTPTHMHPCCGNMHTGTRKLGEIKNKISSDLF